MQREIDLIAMGQRERHLSSGSWEGKMAKVMVAPPSSPFQVGELGTPKGEAKVMVRVPSSPLGSN